MQCLVITLYKLLDAIIVKCFYNTNNVLSPIKKKLVSATFCIVLLSINMA